VNVLHAKELAMAAGSGGQEGGSLLADYNEKFATPYIAAEKGYVDEVIMPRETRKEAHPRA